MRYFKYILLVSVLAFIGAFLNDNGMTALSELLEKKASLSKENQDISLDIESLERMASKLRTDPRTVELAAKRKLGMVRQDETIYVFKSVDKKQNKVSEAETLHATN